MYNPSSPRDGWRTARLALVLAAATAASLRPTVSLHAEEAGASPRTVVGGYGEMHARFADGDGRFALDRVVLFVGSELADGLRVEVETEVEDAHEVELEEAYLEWDASPRSSDCSRFRR